MKKILFLLLSLAFSGQVAIAAEGGSWHVIESFEVGPTAYVRALAMEPARDAMWVGTSVGLHEVEISTGKLRNTFTRKDGLANEYVFGIGIDKAGYKWFGTNAGGVSRYKDGKWKTFFPMHGLADYWVYTFANQKDGTLWIGTWAGANSVSPKGKWTTYVKELVNEWVYGIDVDSKDRVWFGTEGGISMFDGKKWQSWTHNDGLGAPNKDKLPTSPNTGLGTRARHDLGVMTASGAPTYNPNYVFSVHVGPDDVVWAGTWGGGVSSFDGKKWTNLTTENGLAGNLVYSIVRGKDGALWFGTNNGVSRYDGKAWMNFNKKDGLLENTVYTMAVAPNGDIWVGTKRGVARIGK